MADSRSLVRDDQLARTLLIITLAACHTPGPHDQRQGYPLVKIIALCPCTGTPGPPGNTRPTAYGLPA